MLTSVSTPTQNSLSKNKFFVPSEVEFEDGTKINTKNMDYKLIKPLIWWE